MSLVLDWNCLFGVDFGFIVCLFGHLLGDSSFPDLFNGDHVDICALGDEVGMCFNFLECGNRGAVLPFWFCGKLSSEEDVCLCYLLFCGSS
jgi:hypothetical protein